MSKWTSRKFWSAWVIEIVFVVLLCVGKLNGAEFIQGTTWLWGFYFAANVGVTFVSQPRPQS